MREEDRILVPIIEPMIEYAEQGGSGDTSTKPSSSNMEYPKTKLDEKILKNRVFLKNLEWLVHENLLKKFFSRFGPIRSTRIIRDDESRSKGFGYVEFKNEKDAISLLSAHPSELMLKERQIVVQPFVEKAKPIVKKENKRINASANEIVENADYINKLPPDLLLIIFSWISLKDLCNTERGFILIS